jgi:hypothetical protein
MNWAGMNCGYSSRPDHFRNSQKGIFITARDGSLQSRGFHI